MTRRQIFRTASLAKFAMAAGRAPICWRRGLTREVSQIGSLRRACAWVEPLTRISFTLNDEPLFGRSIAHLVEAVIAKSADDAVRRPRGLGGAHAAPTRSAAGNRAGRSRRRSQTRPRDSVVERQYVDQVRPLRGARPNAPPAQLRNETDRLQARNQSRTGDKSGRSSPDSYESDAERGQAPKNRAAKVAQLPQWASSELLESRANSQQHLQRRPGDQRMTAVAPTPRSFKASPQKTPGADQALTKHKTDRERLRADFTAVSQRTNDPGATAKESFAQRLVRRTANAIRRLRPPADEESQSSEWLVDQWRTPLAGTAVPGDWLSRLATAETSATRAKQSEGDPMHSSPLAAHHQASTLQRTEENSVTRAQRIAENSPSAREALEALAPDRRDGSIGDEREDDGDTANRGSAERVAPPSLAASLPALFALTTPQTAPAGVLPLASETARSGAREEARPPEDLDALAAKIKLILDEQARRHGIDV